MKISQKSFERAMVGIGGILLLAFAIAASPRAVPQSPKWLFNGAAVDTGATLTCCGTTPTTDTLSAISTADFKWDLSTTPATAHGVAKLILYTTGTALATDTLFVALDKGPTATGPWVSGTFSNAVLGTAQDGAVDFSIAIDNDANNNPYLWPYWRFRVRADGNNGAAYPSTKAIFVGFSWNK